jgi:predicted CopG family antitoxin
MSIKTIAVDVKTYENLSRAKRPSESFTKTIDRLLKDARSTYTCGNAFETVSSIVKSPLSSQEADDMEKVVQDNRRNTHWNQPDWS